MPTEKNRRRLKIFLCHAGEDKPKVVEFCQRLRREGFQPWIDSEDIPAGAAWESEIENALHTCDAVVVFLSNHSISKRGVVQKEIRIALDTAKEVPFERAYLFTARLEQCKVPRELSKIQYVNLYEPDGFQRLVSGLKLIRESKLRSERPALYSLRFKEFDERKFEKLINALNERFGLHNIRFHPDHKDLFTEMQRTHVAPGHDLDNSGGFLHRLSQVQDQVRKFSLVFSNKDDSTAGVIEMSIDLDGRSLSLDNLIGHSVSVPGIVEVIKRFF